MKRILSVLFTACLMFTLVACGNSVTESGETSTSTQPTEEATMPEDTSSTMSENNSDTDSDNSENGKILVAYFSYSGNTQKVADLVAEKTGGELVRIETVTPYSEDRDEVLDVAQNEQAENARPELSTKVENMDDYDTVFIGYPNWWGSMPMAICSFLEGYDFTGKTIVPFCTHGGSALGSSESDIAALVPNSTMLEGLAIRDSNVDNADSDVEEWLGRIDISNQE